MVGFPRIEKQPKSIGSKNRLSFADGPLLNCLVGKNNMSPKKPEVLSIVKNVDNETSHVTKVFKSDALFRDDPAKVDIAKAVAAWTVLDTFEEIVKDRKSAYRSHLMESAKVDGSKTNKGGYVLEVENSEIYNEFRQDKLPQEDKLKELLAARRIPFLDGFDEVKTLQINPSKIKYLIETGRLNQKEVDDLKKTSYAMKVKPSQEIKQKLTYMSDILLGVETKKLTK